MRAASRSAALDAIRVAMVFPATSSAVARSQTLPYAQRGVSSRILLPTRPKLLSFSTTSRRNFAPSLVVLVMKRMIVDHPRKPSSSCRLVRSDLHLYDVLFPINFECFRLGVPD